MTVCDDLDKQVHGAGGPQPGRRLGEGRVELEAQALEGGWDGKTHRVRVGGSSVTEERLQGQDSARGGRGGPWGAWGAALERVTALARGQRTWRDRRRAQGQKEPRIPCPEKQCFNPPDTNLVSGNSLGPTRTTALAASPWVKAVTRDCPHVSRKQWVPRSPLFCVTSLHS